VPAPVRQPARLRPARRRPRRRVLPRRAGRGRPEVARRWREPDAGIWEVRGVGAHHVHSKLMAWLALDRAVRIAEHHRTPRRQGRVWEQQRDALAAEVTVKGFDTSRSAYTRTYGSHDVDAALLILPLLGIEPPGSPRVRGTIQAIRGELSAGGPLLYRYPPGHRRPARRRRRLPAVLILAHPGTRHHRPGPGSRGTVRAAAGAGQPGRALRRGDGPVHPRAPGQLPASSHPRGARPSRARAPRYSAAGRWKGRGVMRARRDAEFGARRRQPWQGSAAAPQRPGVRSR
jgi:hypothetical protein